MDNKLYKKYLSLKIEDSSYFYIFKTANVYLIMSDDAQILAPLLNLELTNLNSIIPKCVFPVDSLNLYLSKLKNLNIKFKIVELPVDIFNYELSKCCSSNTINDVISNFLIINVDDLSISQSFELLRNLQSKFKKLC